MQGEPGGFAVGDMFTGSAGDGPLGSAEDAGVGFPGAETEDGGTRAEGGGAGGGGENMARIEEAAADVVEVVRVVFMGEEDCVDRREVGEGERRRDGVVKGDGADGEGAGRRGEEGVGEEGGGGGFEDGGGSADVSDLEVAEGRHCNSWAGRSWGEGRKGFIMLRGRERRGMVYIYHSIVDEPRTTVKARMSALMILAGMPSVVVLWRVLCLLWVNLAVW